MTCYDLLSWPVMTNPAFRPILSYPSILTYSVGEHRTPENIHEPRGALRLSGLHLASFTPHQVPSQVSSGQSWPGQSDMLSRSSLQQLAIECVIAR
jgi:hypothetical protein